MLMYIIHYKVEIKKITPAPTSKHRIGGRDASFAENGGILLVDVVQQVSEPGWIPTPDGRARVPENRTGPYRG
jgi:hypothetical protein